MKLTIGRKLTSAFLVLAAIVFIAGLIGSMMVQQVAGTGEEILREKVPLADVSMEAIIAAQDGIIACREYMQAHDNLDEIEARIHESIEDFDMFMAMVRYGTESEAFKNSPAGEMYVKDGIDLVVYPGNAKMQAIVEEADATHLVFEKKAFELIDAHNHRMGYHSQIDGKTYNLFEVFAIADVMHRRWVEQLENAVEYEIEFTGQLDPAQCWYGRWRNSYQTDDQALLALLDEFEDTHRNVHEVGREVVNAPADQKASMLSRGIRYTTKAKQQFEKLQDYAGQKLTELEEHENACIDAMLVAADEMFDKLESLEALAGEEMDHARAEAQSAKHTAMMTLYALIAVALAIAVVLGIVITRSITRPIYDGVAFAQRIAQGDLTQSLDLKKISRDEIGDLGRALNDMSTSLQDLIGQVNGSAQEVAGGATEIAASSEEMAQGMIEQNNQITQISSAIEEMSASIVEVARKSADAAGSARESGEVAGKGGEVVKQTISGMNDINDAVTASATSVQELGKRGEQIGQVIEVINDIADQTNLLALNAAIEAARAGEHGRGFAVVADEVRKLADRTTKATEEVSESIKAIQSETTQAVDRMNSGTEQVRKGVELATEAGHSLEEIVTKAQAVADLVQSIAAAAEEQSAASEQISRNVESISSVAGQATEGANQSAGAAMQLSTKAEELQRIVSRFKLAR